MIINQVKTIDKKNFIEFKEDYIDLLNKEDYHIHYLDGKTIETKQDYFDYFKKIYLFGGHFGNNWNAFIDCMRDLDDWYDKQGFVLVVYNYANFIIATQEDKENFVKALEYIAFYLEKECLTTSGGRNHLKSFDVYLVDENIDV
jgi:hypothetical protein